MGNAGELAQENQALRQRLSRLSEASLRISESLDFDNVLQGVLDSARSLTGARYGVITLLDDGGRIQDFLYSGLTPEETRQFAEFPDGMLFFEQLSGIGEPLRLRDFHAYARELGLPEFQPPMAVSSPLPFLAAPLRHRGEGVGCIYVGQKEIEFTAEDEETLVMFASQAALVIANARRHRDEQRARADLETLVTTTPVGVLVLDARTGNPVSVNREARRIVSGLCEPDGKAEQLLEVLTFRRADGREVSLAEFPLSQGLMTGETVRAEEIVLQAPDGRSVATLINATPIFSEDGGVESVVITMQDLTPLEDLERLRAEFLGMVSHELRTPLAAIKGSADTLLENAADLDPAEMTQFFRIIRDQSESMRHLIGDLLDVARIETGTLPVSPEPVEVTVLVDEARSRFQSRGWPQQPGHRPAGAPAPGGGGPAAGGPGADQPAVQRGPPLPRPVTHPGLRRAGRGPRGPVGGRRRGGGARRAICPTCSASSRSWTGRSGYGSWAGRGWAWPSARGSWRPTGAASGPRATVLGWAAGSPSPCRRWTSRPGAPPEGPVGGSAGSRSRCASSAWTTTPRRCATCGTP